MNKEKMRKILFLLTFFLIMIAHAQETDINENIYEEEYDFGTADGITIYGQSPIDAYVLKQLNGTLSDRKQFIETEFLEKSGFRRSGNVQYRRSNGSEKATSVLHGIGHLFSFGIVPIKPFSEIEHNRLPKGEYYKFTSVFIRSNFTNVTSEVLALMELEYMLQIEFCNGIIIQDTINYYTNENIAKFEKMILGLPNFPEGIYQAKNRYLMELEKIKAALERYKNPSENYLRAKENLVDIFGNSR